MLVFEYPLMGENYNDLPTLQQQTKMSPLVLRDLGRLLLAHGVAGRFGIGLLHRHITLPSSYDSLTFMMRDTAARGIEAVQFNSLPDPTVALRGAAFCLFPNDLLDPDSIKHSFAAYECAHGVGQLGYNDSGIRDDAEVAFLDAFRIYVIANSLTRRIALTRLDTAHRRILERPLPAHRCHRYELLGPHDSVVSHSRATEWAFRVGANGDAEPVVTRYCSPPPLTGSVHGSGS